jgi:hypothetical protein
MSKYKNLDKYLEKKGKTPRPIAEKGKFKGQDFKSMASSDKDELLRMIAKDLGYTD